MVEVVKCTFDAASRDCASAIVIQSAADGIGQSPPGPPDVVATAGLADVSDRSDDFELPDVSDGAGLSDDAGAPVAGLPVAAAVSLLLEPSLEPLSAPVAAAVREAREAVDACRSFLAQPDPLKWMVGGEKAFFTGPLPHSGQAVGASSKTPWTASKRRAHAAQS